MESSPKRTIYILGGVVAAIFFMIIGAAVDSDDVATDTANTAGATPTTVTETVTVTAPPETVTAKPKTVTKTVVKTKTRTKTVTQRNPAPPPQNNVYYDNCSEAEAAGDTPLYRGDPGYASHLDGDGDGVACE